MKKIVLLLTFLSTFSSYSQKTDSIFLASRELAFNGQYDTAIVLISSLIQQQPLNSDFIQFKASIFSWQQQNDRAIALLKTIPNYNQSIDISNSIATYYIRNKQYGEALNSCLSSLTIDSKNKTALLLQIDAFFLIEDYQSCFNKCQSIYEKTPHTNQIMNLCAAKIFNKSITIGAQNYLQKHIHTNQYFGQFQLNRNKFNFISTIQSTLSNSQLALQFQQEIYKKWKHRGYTYAGISFSNSTMFPKYAVSLVHFYPIIKNAEIDFGIRYYQSQNTSSNVVPSLGVAYTLQNLVFNYRYYKVFGTNLSGYTHCFSLKHNFKKLDETIKLDLSLGNQLFSFNQLTTNYQIYSQGQLISLNYTKPLCFKFKIGLGFSFSNNMINETSSKKFFMTNLSLNYKF